MFFVSLHFYCIIFSVKSNYQLIVNRINDSFIDRKKEKSEMEFSLTVAKEKA